VVHQDRHASAVPGIQRAATADAMIAGIGNAEVAVNTAIQAVVGRPVPRPQGVVPVPTVQPIETSATDHRVATRLAAYLIPTTATDHAVATIAAADQVCADATVHQVRPGTTEQPV
jgi:hypothetical protein